MHSLSTFPSEILQRIFRQAEASNIIVALWKCGDKKFNELLASGGCDTVLLKDVDPSSTSRWPALLCQLRGLRSLSIDRMEAHIHTTEDLALALRTLSPTIEHLKINARGVLEALFESTTKRIDGLIVHERRLWNISEPYPNLRTLGIGNGMFVNHSSPPFSLLDILPVLPPTLTSLNLAIEEMSSSNLRTGKLPSGLKEIKLLRCSPLVRWPQSLVKIDGIIASEEDYLDSLDHMPRGLNELSNKFWPAETPLTGSTWDALPKNLRSLSLNGGIDDKTFPSLVWTECLPQTLNRLEFTVSRAPTLTWAFIQGLPRTLTHLLDVNINFEDIRHSSEMRNVFDGVKFTGTVPWPKQLSTLRLANGGLPTISRATDLQFLPTTVTNLEGLRVGPDRGVGLHPITRSAPFNCANYILDFTKLKVLAISGDHQVAFSEGLPLSLTSLKICGLVELGGRPDAELETRTGRMLGGHRSTPPPTPPKFIAPLPPTLINLHIDIEDGESTLSILERLPFGLKSLHFFLPDKVFLRSSLGIGALRESLLGCIDASKLPPGLKDLSVDSNDGIPSDICLRLPTRLESLSCKLNTSITIHHIVALPPSLQNFIPNFVGTATISDDLLAKWPDRTLSELGKLRYETNFRTSPWSQAYNRISELSFSTPDPRLDC